MLEGIIRQRCALEALRPSLQNLSKESEHDNVLDKAALHEPSAQLAHRHSQGWHGSQIAHGCRLRKFYKRGSPMPSRSMRLQAYDSGFVDGSRL